MHLVYLNFEQNPFFNVNYLLFLPSDFLCISRRSFLNISPPRFLGGQTQTRHGRLLLTGLIVQYPIFLPLFAAVHSSISVLNAGNPFSRICLVTWDESVKLPFLSPEELQRGIAVAPIPSQNGDRGNCFSRLWNDYFGRFSGVSQVFTCFIHSARSMNTSWFTGKGG